MSVKPENTFRASVHKHLKDPNIDQEKMSNPYTSGTADDWYSGPAGDLWVEYKFVPRLPQRVDVKICSLFSTLQLEWLARKHDHGRNVAAIIGCPIGGIILRNKEWEVETMSVTNFTSRVLSRADLAAWIRQQVKG